MNVILQQILESLDPKMISENIDFPIENATSTFEEELPLKPTHQAFNRIIIDYIQRIYESLGYSISEDEAFKLLEERYRNGESYGYNGAYLDAIDEGLQYVLNILEEIIKQTEREKYFTRCITQFVDPTDKILRGTIASEIKGMYGPYIHPAIDAMSSIELSSKYEIMLQILIESQNDLINCLN